MELLNQPVILGQDFPTTVVDAEDYEPTAHRDVRRGKKRPLGPGKGGRATDSRAQDESNATKASDERGRDHLALVAALFQVPINDVTAGFQIGFLHHFDALI